jgi:hypothetical protein
VTVKDHHADHRLVAETSAAAAATRIGLLAGPAQEPLDHASELAVADRDSNDGSRCSGVIVYGRPLPFGRRPVGYPVDGSVCDGHDREHGEEQ